MVLGNLESLTVQTSCAGTLYRFHCRYSNKDVISEFMEVAGIGFISFPRRLMLGHVGQYAVLYLWPEISCGRDLRRQAEALGRREAERIKAGGSSFATASRDEAQEV